MSLHIRLLTAEDKQAYHYLHLKSLREEPRAFLHHADDALQWSLEHFVRRFMRGKTAGAFFIDQLVGFASLNQYEGRKVRHKGNIGPVYVVPQYRGKGLASHMLQKLEEEARKDGIEHLMLSTDAANEANVRLYRKLGYEPWGVEKHILKLDDGSYVDDVVMLKMLKH